MTFERSVVAQGNGRLRRWVLLLGALGSVSLTACAAAEGAGTGPAAAPEACLDAADATRGSIAGTPVWARFCPGPERHTLPAEVPSDALTTHLGLLDALEERDAVATAEGWPCDELSSTRTYELQLGYADGRVAAIAGGAAPECTGRLAGGAAFGGPDGLGVYGVLMTAFGRQYADGFEDSPSEAPLVCPDDPRDPDGVDLEGASAPLDTGYLFGERSPMVMPLTAVRGIACTWPFGGGEPDVRELTAEEAERVRIGLHAIPGGIVDCQASPDPTHTAVVEDRTGTRRAVTIDDSNCSTVIRSDHGPWQGFGLDFPWLDR